MSELLQYSREAKGWSRRSKRYFFLSLIVGAIVASWFIWGRSALERAIERRELNRLWNHAFPVGTVAYTDDIKLCDQLRNQPGYRSLTMANAIAYDAGIPKSPNLYSNGFGLGTVFIGGRKSAEGIERLIDLGIIDGPAWHSQNRRSISLFGSLLKEQKYGNGPIKLQSVENIQQVIIYAPPAATFIVWGGQADPNDPSKLSIECAIDAKRFHIDYQLVGDHVTVTPVGIEFDKVYDWISVYDAVKMLPARLEMPNRRQSSPGD